VLAVRLLACLLGLAIPSAAQGEFPFRVERTLDSLYGLRPGDLDGDGVPDLLTCGYDWEPARASAHFGNGLREFGTRVDFATNQCGAVEIADIDGDGAQEALLGVEIGGIGGALQTWRVTRHAQTLLAQSTIGFRAGKLIAADFDGDGVVDLAAGNGDTGLSSIVMLRGLGDGTFTKASLVYPNAVVVELRVVDLNGDGLLDFGGLRNPSAFTILNQGSFSFAAVKVVPKSTAFASVDFGDIDRDGIVDLIAGALPTSFPPTPAGILVLRGIGDGTFQPPMLAHALTEEPRRVRVAEFDGDGVLDVGVLDISGFRVWRGDGSAGFAAGPVVGGCGRAKHLELTDQDANGLPDVVIGFDRHIVLMPNPVQGTQATPLVSSTSAFTPMRVADATGDGLADVIGIEDGVNARVIVQPGRGDGTFASEVLVATVGTPRDVVAADVNADGVPDLISFGANATQSALGVSFGDGSGGFGAVMQTPIYGGFGSVAALVTVDLDHDGDLDVLVAHYDVLVCENQGSGTFQQTSSLVVSGGASRLALADFDHDGWEDLVTIRYLAPDFAILRGTGGGAFSAPLLVPLGGMTREVHVLDVNGDANSDLAFLSDVSPRLTWFLGRGDGTFSRPRIRYFGPSYFPFSFERARANGDHCDDIALVRPLHQQGFAEILLGTQDGDFARSDEHLIGEGPALCGDLDGDGLDDLVSDSLAELWVSLHL
jgi:hypothetical protein